MTDDQLREQLTLKRTALHHAEMRVARYGMSADPYIIIERDDLLAEVRSLERRLGREQTPTPQEIRREYVPRPRYVEPPQVFQERVVGEQIKQRQEEIAHQVKLLGIHRRNLGHVREQLKELGAYAPPYVRNSVHDAMASIASIKRTLRDMGQNVDDLPGDE